MAGIERCEFIALFNEMYRPVRNFVYYKTADMETADDIAQDTFAKIWEMRDEVKPKTVKSLLYSIASNLYKNQFDKKRVRYNFANNYQNDAVAVSPEFELEFKEFNERLQKAVEGLKEKNRTVFLMNRIDKMTYSQIAENLGLSVKAVEKRMKNALDDLKTSIEYSI